MSKNSKNEYIKKFKAFTIEINSTKAKAKAFYSKAGILTPTGRLRKNYKHESIKES